MTKGIRFRNSRGYTQIDTRYQNTAFISKGTVSGSGYLKVEVPANCAAAIRPSAPCLSYLQKGVNGGTVLYCRLGPHKYWARGTLTVDYYIFGPSSLATPAGTKGVRIRGYDGAVAFDTRIPYMRVLGYEPPASAYPSRASVSTTNQYDPLPELIGSAFVNYSRGVPLAALCTTPRLSQQVTWPYGPPGSSGQVQDFEVSVEAECIMASGNDIRLYSITQDMLFMDVPVSYIAPEIIGRSGSGTILIDVTGL